MFVCFFVFYTDSDGRITGSDAIKFFSMSNLPRQDLKQVYFFLILIVYFFLFILVYPDCFSSADSTFMYVYAYLFQICFFFINILNDYSCVSSSDTLNSCYASLSTAFILDFTMIISFASVMGSSYFNHIIL